MTLSDSPSSTTFERQAMSGVKNNIVETIGNTPLVRLNSVNEGIAADMMVKVEYMNPGGSVKDRIGISIVEAAERDGRLQPGGTIVEPTSGNTGVGLAMAAALRGYKCIFVMPDKMSDEKIRTLRAYGAKVVITPTAVAPEDPRSYYSVADRLVDETPGAILGNQYHNPANPAAHYRSTGPELWRQTDGKITHFIVCLGTGGTISGTGKYLKEMNPDIQIVGVDPEGSILHDLFYTGEHEEAQTYLVEGIGEDFLPTTTDFSYVDDVVRVNDAECFEMTRRIVREEGIFVGGSCGAAMAGALKYVRSRELGPEAVVVVLLPDSGARYLSKLFNDDWMRDHGFEVDTGGARVSDLLASLQPREVISAKTGTRVGEVVDLMKASDISQVPVVDDQGMIVGEVSERDILTSMLDSEKKFDSDSPIDGMIGDRIVEITPQTALMTLAELFSMQGKDIAAVKDGSEFTAVITKIDLVDYLTQTAGK